MSQKKKEEKEYALDDIKLNCTSLCCANIYFVPYCKYIMSNWIIQVIEESNYD